MGPLIRNKEFIIIIIIIIIIITPLADRLDCELVT